MTKNLIFIIITFCVVILFFSCNKMGNRFYISHFGQDGSNSYTTGDNAYLDNSWGYNGFSFNTTQPRYENSDSYHVRDTGTHDFACCGQSVFFDLDFNRH